MMNLEDLRSRVNEFSKCSANSPGEGMDAKKSLLCCMRPARHRPKSSISLRVCVPFVGVRVTYKMVTVCTGFHCGTTKNDGDCNFVLPNGVEFWRRQLVSLSLFNRYCRFAGHGLSFKQEELWT